MSNSLEQDQVPHFVCPDLGPNCLQKVSVDDKSHSHLFKKKCLGILSECQTVWIQIRTDVGPDLGPNCLLRLDKSRH